MCYMGFGISTVLTFRPGWRMTEITSVKSAKNSIFPQLESVNQWSQFLLPQKPQNSPFGNP